MTAGQTGAESSQKRIIQDNRGRRFELHPGRDSTAWCDVFRAVEEGSARPVIVRLPKAALEPRSSDPTNEVRTFEAIINERVARLKKFPPRLVPRSSEVMRIDGVLPCLVEDRFGLSLEQRLNEPLTFRQLCDTLLAVAGALNLLHETGQVHGNLKPANIFLVNNADGQLEARFNDPLNDVQLSPRADRGEHEHRWMPPEAKQWEKVADASVVADTFALGKLLQVGICGLSEITFAAMDKSTLSTIKERLAQRLEQDESNPHVRETLLRRAVAFLGRAGAAEIQPSPPFRFRNIAEVISRLEELRELFQPGFSQVGNLLVDHPPATQNLFSTDDDIRFALSFRCEGGLEQLDLIETRTYVRNLETDQKVKGAVAEVSPIHDGNRFRFVFKLEPLLPAQYLFRVMLGVRGSPESQITRDFVFDIRRAEGQIGAKPGDKKATSRDPNRNNEITPAVGSASRGNSREDLSRETSLAVDASKAPVVKNERSVSSSSANKTGRSDATTGKGTATESSRPAAKSPAADAPSQEWYGVKTPPGRDLVWVADGGAAKKGTEDMSRSGRSEDTSAKPSSRDASIPIPKTAGSPSSIKIDASKNRSGERSTPPSGEFDKSGDDKPAKIRVSADHTSRSEISGSYRVERSGPSGEKISDRDRSTDKSGAVVPAREKSEKVYGKSSEKGTEKVTARAGEKGLEKSGELSMMKALEQSLAKGLEKVLDRGAGRSGEKATSADETNEMTVHDVPPGQHGALRARLEPAPVGRDAAHQVPRDLERGDHAAKVEKRSPGPVIGSTADRASTASPMARESGNHKVSDVSARKSREDGGSRGENASKNARTDTPGKPGQQFIPELYYKEARTPTVSVEEDDEFFKKGALSRQQYVIIIGLLAVVLLGLLAVIVYLVL